MEDTVIISWGSDPRRDFASFFPSVTPHPAGTLLPVRSFIKMHTPSDAIRRSLAWLSVSVRAFSQARDSTWSSGRRYCAVAAASRFKYTPLPHPRAPFPSSHPLSLACQAVLSFSSSCSRLFDNGGKSVLKRQLNTALLCQAWGGSWLRLMIIMLCFARVQIRRKIKSGTL